MKALQSFLDWLYDKTFTAEQAQDFLDVMTLGEVVPDQLEWLRQDLKRHFRPKLLERTEERIKDALYDKEAVKGQARTEVGTKYEIIPDDGI